MKRHYFASQNLNDLEQVEHELSELGIDSPQVHVMSEDYAQAEKRNLHNVNSILKSDVIRSGFKGALVGVVLAAGVISIGFITKASTSVEWLPFIFLSIIVLGFCTWEGGFFGFQKKNSEFERFSKIMEGGKHLLFVDVDDAQKPVVNQILAKYPSLSALGEGSSPPSWFVKSHKGVRTFIKAMP